MESVGRPPPFNALMKLFPASFGPVSKHTPCLTVGQLLERVCQNRVAWKPKLGRSGLWEFCWFWRRTEEAQWWITLGCKWKTSKTFRFLDRTAENNDIAEAGNAYLLKQGLGIVASRHLWELCYVKLPRTPKLALHFWWQYVTRLLRTSGDIFVCHSIIILYFSCVCI